VHVGCGRTRLSGRKATIRCCGGVLLAATAGSRAGLDDCLYLSLSNAASFMPPENTLPLTTTAKLLLGLQTLASVTTLTVILSYAIHDLAQRG
jgi:hypothetical protein